MKIQIDQSGKLEMTKRHTVIAFSNGINFTAIISAKDKKYLQSIFRKAGTPKIFIYKTFAVIIYIITRKYIKKIDEIAIDIEYPGYNKLIKQLIIEIFKKNKIEFDINIIYFKEVGKLSNAHKIAISSYRNKKADMKISAKDILKIML